MAKRKKDSKQVLAPVNTDYTKNPATLAGFSIISLPIFIIGDLFAMAMLVAIL